MAERALPFVNVAMRGGGYFSAATKGAKDVIDGATPLVLDAIRRMPDAGASSPFTLTDMGCADQPQSLYPDTRIREFSELKAETISRAAVLAARAHIAGVEDSLRRSLQQRTGQATLSSRGE